MSGTVKGIIVEIGGNTSGLQKALSKVNSATVSLTKELRGVNSLLKLDPKNTELLSQKQQILSKDIEDTENKLKILHSTYQRGVEAEANGSKISEENWRNLQREIINTENKLKSLKLEASNWTQAGKKLEEFGGKIDNLGGRIENLGNKLTKTFTVSIVGAGVASIKSAMDFETAFTGVEKTVDGTDEQIANLKQGIKDLATEIPSSTTEISAVAEAAGQLGIQTDNVLNFTKTMIDMGNATNLSADEAATTLARFANITKMKQSDFNKLGSVIVALGNNFATTESEIADMGMNLASAGTQVGMSQSQIMALATALSSVGLEAQAGGTAFSKVMVNMQLAVEKGGNQLKNFASVAGMSTKEFKRAFKEDATTAIMKFVEGLSKSGERGKSAIKVLDDMGITETRLRDSLLRSANASSIFSKAIEIGNQEWNENTALANEANKRYATLESRFKKTMNKANNLTTSLGNKLTPTIGLVLDKVDNFMDKLNGLTDEETENIVKTGLMVASIGPLVKIIGKVTSTTGNAIKGVGLFSQAIGAMRTGTTTGIVEVDKLAKGLSALTSPATIAATSVAIAMGVIITQIKKAEKEMTDSLQNVGNSATNFVNGISSANSHLDSFNSTLFASSQEQEELKKNMNEVQQGITNICKKATDERRGYTQEEITQLDEYFKKLRELKNRELEIQQNIANAISQQAITNANTFQGTLDEYKVQSQEWIKTAEEQKNNTINIIKDGTTQEIALLNQKYGDQSNMQNEAYAKEYNEIIEQQQKKIDAANLEVSKVTEAYSNGYLQRSNQDNGFYTTLSEYNKKVEDENNRHAKELESINNNILLDTDNKNRVKENENNRHEQEIKKIWQKMYKDMDESKEKQLGIWLAQVSQTELYGGQIDEKNKKVVDSILSSYDSMPNKTREAMKNAMTPMLEEMENKEPSLFAKATGIADGILTRLKQGFDIHSPSRKVRKIFNFAMEGAEIGIEDKEQSLYKKIGNISSNALEKFRILDSDLQLGNVNQSIIEKTKTIFTTPQITFNVQDLDKERLEQCFSYINKKFGSLY